MYVNFKKILRKNGQNRQSNHSYKELSALFENGFFNKTQ
jgi:hypothetical protein